MNGYRGKIGGEPLRLYQMPCGSPVCGVDLSGALSYGEFGLRKQPRPAVQMAAIKKPPIVA